MRGWYLDMDDMIVTVTALFIFALHQLILFFVACNLSTHYSSDEFILHPSQLHRLRFAPLSHVSNKKSSFLGVAFSHVFTLTLAPLSIPIRLLINFFWSSPLSSSSFNALIFLLSYTGCCFVSYTICVVNGAITITSVSGYIFRVEDLLMMMMGSGLKQMKSISSPYRQQLALLERPPLPQPSLRMLS